MNQLTVPSLSLLRSRVEYQGLILGLICSLVTLLLLVGENITWQPIQDQLAKDRLATLAQVLPADLYDNDPLKDALLIEDASMSSRPVEVLVAKKEGQISAMVFQLETEGYGGTITLMMGVNLAGEILGIRTVSHKETPGLADKIEIEKSQWIIGFNGNSLENTPLSDWAVKKDGGKFDQFTGATITPRAVVRGVVSGLDFHARQVEHIKDSVLNKTDDSSEE